MTGVGYAPEGQLLREGRPVTVAEDDDLGLLLRASGLCNNARLVPPKEDNPRWSILGDPTEAAMQVVALKGGVDFSAEDCDLPRVRELPFESRRKRMSTIHLLDGGRVAYVKGAPRETVALSTQVWRDGAAYPLDDATRARILEANDGYARAGLRVLAIAQRPLPLDLAEFTPEAVEQELTFVGLVAMMDPPRPEVAAAVQKCYSAGIRIVMITGDYGLTAESIARRIGIIRGPQARVITGGDLDAMSHADLEVALRDEVLFARVTPEHKLRVVSTLQDMGEVVAVTGDGVNDAPALKRPTSAWPWALPAPMWPKRPPT